MLHGDVKINEAYIAKWTAVRGERVWKNLDPDDNPTFFRYRCRLEYVDLSGYPMEAEFDVTHRYGDGAVVLASRVLAVGFPKLRKKVVDA